MGQFVSINCYTCRKICRLESSITVWKSSLVALSLSDSSSYELLFSAREENGAEVVGKDEYLTSL